MNKSWIRINHTFVPSEQMISHFDWLQAELTNRPEHDKVHTSGIFSVKIGDNSDVTITRALIINVLTLQWSNDNWTGLSMIMVTFYYQFYLL